MRCYLKAELRQAYKIAWSMLPTAVQKVLKTGIVDIRSAPSLEGMIIKGSNASGMSTKEANGWCVRLGEKEIYIRLNDRLKEEDEAGIVYTILHEFAHVLESLEDEDWRVETRLEARTELAANAQVAAWAARDASRPTLGGYRESQRVADYALSAALTSYWGWDRASRELTIGGNMTTNDDLARAVEMARLSEIARADMADFLNFEGNTVQIDLKKAEERGVLHLIKEIGYDAEGNVISLELQDAQEALIKLGNMMGLFGSSTEEVPGLARD